jgi:hypothetical protein
MSQSQTATIILFPTKPNTPVAASTIAPSVIAPSPEEARLARAAWRLSLGELSTATGRLGATLQSHHDNLGQLGDRVATLHTEAVKLESWADNVIATKG